MSTENVLTRVSVIAPLEPALVLKDTMDLLARELPALPTVTESVLVTVPAKPSRN
jgi:hypothetical protein